MEQKQRRQQAAEFQQAQIRLQTEILKRAQPEGKCVMCSASAVSIIRPQFIFLLGLQCVLKYQLRRRLRPQMAQVDHRVRNWLRLLLLPAALQ